MYIAAPNLISGRVQHDLRHPLNKVVRAVGEAVRSPDKVKGDGRSCSQDGCDRTQ